MVIEVVGLVGSPRKGMNTDTLVSKVLEGARSIGAAIKKIYLNDLDIKPCQACDTSPAPECCFYKDGMDEIYQVLETADVIVIGTPAYYGSISSQLKLIIDRSNCLTEMIELADGKVRFQTRIKKKKKGIFIWIADYSRDPGPALASIKYWLKDVNIELIDKIVVTDSDRGQGARMREDLLSKAFEIGRALERLGK